MTQMGFVTIVLLAPAIIDDQKLMTKVFSTGCQYAVRQCREHRCLCPRALGSAAM